MIVGSAPSHQLSDKACTSDFLRFEVHFSCSVWLPRRESILAIRSFKGVTKFTTLEVAIIWGCNLAEMCRSLAEICNLGGVPCFFEFGQYR